MRQAIASSIGPRVRNAPRWRAQETFLPFPSGGWDTETPLPELPQTRARKITNWMPRGVSGEIRGGYTTHATGLGAAVETLMAYNAGAASTLFAAAGSDIYDVTAAGAVGAAVVSSLTSARLSYVNFTTSGGAFLWVCNGEDDPRHWNGSAWATPSLSMTTYNDNDIQVVAAFKERLFFIIKDTLVFAYLPVQNVAGTVTNFPLGAVFSYGGRLIGMGTLTRDGGAGLDDLMLFLTSEGEIAVYQGSNPGDADEWALVGVYYVGEPVGDRPLVKQGVDLGVITVNGVVSVLEIMAAGQSPDRIPYLTAQITTPFREHVAATAAENGWEGIFFPGADVLLINAPEHLGRTQFVRHRVTGGWGDFDSWPFQTFEVFGGELYAGDGSDTVVKCFSGFSDGGADVIAPLDTAWTTLGYPGVKAFQEVRPIVTTGAATSMRITGRADFSDDPPLPAWPIPTVTDALVWDVGNWDEKFWGGKSQVGRGWRAISGEGTNLSLATEARTNQGRLAINGFNLRYATGGQV